MIFYQIHYLKTYIYVAKIDIYIIYHSFIQSIFNHNLLQIIKLIMNFKIEKFIANVVFIS